ncbi:DUF6522 family protein [Pannonibacter carbonis]|uniref:DUF6522 family protein n=1 Tax=Pannonibacter carbonis TaxID=2067569 RepID=UPI000D1076FB|nr:DUF6522 family protein [Pannonibacter carbonis]
MMREDMTLDAADIARGLGLAAGDLIDLMRAGKITGRLYKGENEDAGTYACVFFHANRRLTLVVDEAGTLLRRSNVDFGDQPLPPAMRRGPAQ